MHTQQDLRGNFKRFVIDAIQNWNLESDRFEVWQSLEKVRELVWVWLTDGDSFGRDYSRMIGLVVDQSAPSTIFRKKGYPSLEVHSARPCLRRTNDGSVRVDLVIEITQRRRGYFDRKKQEQMDALLVHGSFDPPDFTFRAGCTLLVDPRTAEVRRIIRTAGTIADPNELDRVRRFLTGEAGTTGNAFEAGLQGGHRQNDKFRDEPFALLHQCEED
jgi:hypothetical protein